ncbi:lipopolysaccharide biosynthesis protein [Domibacillus iocasae]|uniref:Polysaccharide biosynthesis protein C-terminal domain-containing protein n=1 Tax=Domibacillus iocasae TaxID=1714016 RepID=A0A1E7DPM7_9BACI|nr:oligosaccharide flippase family protein [Domibacillus iocasae]OES44955.1 hypothetical protein BA724_06745 [Domibacillus iocasae]
MNSKQLKLATALAYLSTFLQNGINLFFTPFLLRVLGKAEYGLYALIGSFVGYIALLDFGLGNTVTRYIAQYEEKGEKTKQENLIAICLIVYVLIGLIILAVGYGLFINLETIFKRGLMPSQMESAKIMFALLLLNIVLSLPINIFNAVMQGYEKFTIIHINSIIRVILSPVIITVLLVMGYKAVAIIVVNTILNVLVGLFNIFYVLVYLKLKVKLHHWDASFLKEIGRYSFFIFLGVFVDQIYWRTGQVILGIYTDSSTVAVYAIAMQFCLYYMTISTIISGTLFPKVNQMVARGVTKQELSLFFAKTGSLQLIILGMVLGGFIVVGREFISLWAGKDYAEAWLYALIIMIPLTVPLIQSVGIGIIQAKNRHAFRSIMYFIVALINIAISLAVVGKYGAVGLSITTALSLIGGNIIIINLYYHYKIGIDIAFFWKYNAKNLLAIFLSTVCSFLLLKNISLSNEYVEFMCKTVIFCSIYFLFGWSIVLRKEEKMKIIGKMKWVHS